MVWNSICVNGGGMAQEQKRSGGGGDDDELRPDGSAGQERRESSPRTPTTCSTRSTTCWKRMPRTLVRAYGAEGRPVNRSPDISSFTEYLARHCPDSLPGRRAETVLSPRRC